MCRVVDRGFKLIGLGFLSYDSSILPETYGCYFFGVCYGAAVLLLLPCDDGYLTGESTLLELFLAVSAPEEPGAAYSPAAADACILR